MSAAERDDPYVGYRFLVEVDGLIVGGFSEVSGLEVSVDTEDYAEGGVNAYTHTLPTRYEHENLVLERGLTDATELWEWFRLATNDPPRPADATPRRTVRILLQDATGAESWGWQCRDALPVAYTGPELSAADDAVAMESLELAHRGLTRIRGLP